MLTYLNRAAGVLNAALFVFALVMLQDANVRDLKTLLFAILLIVTPTFTLFALFAPHGRDR